MSKSLHARLDRLEMLCTEQDYTIQSLNDMVAQQGQEISRLNASIEQLKEQLQAMKSGPPGSGFEKPPHY